MRKMYTAESIQKRLDSSFYRLNIIDETPSTNTAVRTLAEDGASEGTVLLARSQSAGRGRSGHSFFSPKDTGIYMSILLRPKLAVQDALRITTAAAVAVTETIRAETFLPAEIKWVNDIYCEDRKVCGILTEASIKEDGQSLGYAVLGIGINVFPPKDNFPEDIRSIASALSDTVEKDLQSRLIAGVLNRFRALYLDLLNPKILQKYKAYSCLLGKEIYVVGNESITGTAVDFDDAFRLCIQTENKETLLLDSGEVSVRKKERA